MWLLFTLYTLVLWMPTIACWFFAFPQLLFVCNRIKFSLPICPMLRCIEKVHIFSNIKLLVLGDVSGMTLVLRTAAVTAFGNSVDTVNGWPPAAILWIKKGQMSYYFTMSIETFSCLLFQCIYNPLSPYITKPQLSYITTRCHYWYISLKGWNPVINKHILNQISFKMN